MGEPMGGKQPGLELADRELAIGARGIGEAQQLVLPLEQFGLQLGRAGGQEGGKGPDAVIEIVERSLGLGHRWLKPEPLPGPGAAAG